MAAASAGRSDPILSVLAWATAATTVYTITDRRVAMRIGIALTLTLNLPFKSVAAAQFKASSFGTGDIALALSGPTRSRSSSCGRTLGRGG